MGRLLHYVVQFASGARVRAILGLLYLWHALASVHYTLENFQFPSADDLYWKACLNSVKIAAGWLLSFILSLDDLVIATFTSGPGASTLPMGFSKVRLGVTPDMNALASVLIGVVAVGVVVAGVFMHRHSRSRTRDVQLAAARNS